MRQPAVRSAIRTVPCSKTLKSSAYFPASFHSSCTVHSNHTWHQASGFSGDSSPIRRAARRVRGGELPDVIHQPRELEARSSERLQMLHQSRTSRTVTPACMLELLRGGLHALGNTMMTAWPSLHPSYMKALGFPASVDSGLDGAEATQDCNGGTWRYCSTDPVRRAPVWCDINGRSWKRCDVGIFTDIAGPGRRSQGIGR